MSDISDYLIFVEQNGKLLEVVDWAELSPIKKHLAESLSNFDYLFYNAAKAMIKN
jgi:RIO-like serine/threonine protein kinase